MTFILLNKKNSNKDHRGFFVEFLNESEKKLGLTGQIYFTSINKNCSRGNHYHKKRSEIFCLVKGKIKVITKNIKTNKRRSVLLDASKNYFQTILIEPFNAHLFINIFCEEAIIVSYTDHQYRNNNKDVFSFNLKDENN